MNFIQLARTLGRNDVRIISRDHFLLSMFAFVVVIATVLRFGLPWLDGYLADRGVLPSETNAHRFSDYFPLVLGFLVVFQGPLISGAIFGFSLLDEKDDNTIKAMLVTPIPFERYVLFRITVPAIFAFLIVLFEMLFIGQSLVSLWKLALLSLGASFVAPLAALFYAIFAENKVQGFAIAKFVGISGWVILLGWFVSGPWQWAFGLFPPFLVCKAYWMALDGNAGWWLALVAGVLLQIGLLWWFTNLFRRVSYL